LSPTSPPSDFNSLENRKVHGRLINGSFAIHFDHIAADEPDLIDRCARIPGNMTLFPLEAEDISDHVIRISAGNNKIGHFAMV